jgi:2-aminoadipate transaminase
MDYYFTPAADKLKPSAIREILKLSSAPDIIPFSAGNPSPEAFPTDVVKKFTAEILNENPIGALQYSVTEGFNPLREYLKKYMQEKYSTGSDNDDIIITCGAQQVMSLSANSLAGPGDTILCESPSFVGSLNALKLSGANLVGIPMESDGMNIELLEKAIKENANVRLLYIIPNFQNPTGITTSLLKRKAIYEIAKKNNILIVEDNPYGDLYFNQAPPATIKSMDTEGIVIYAGSFSKVLAPGLRVGWCIAPKTLIAKFTAIKQTQDVHSNILAQMLAYKFMTEYDFEAHLDYLRDLYVKKAALCFELMDKHLAPEIEFQKAEGGLFAWCKLPEGIGMPDFCTRAVKEYKTAVVPGSAFDIAPIKNQYFRINYSTPTNEQIIKGMDLLEKLKKEVIK